MLNIVTAAPEVHHKIMRGLANFFRTELPKLKEEDKKLLRHSINIIREKAKEEYNAENHG